MHTFSIYNSVLSKLATICMVGIAVVLMIQPQWPIVKATVKYAEWVALAIVGFGLCMLAFKQRRLMFASMLSAGAICVYFDQSETPIVKADSQIKTTQIDFQIGHYNLSNHNAHPDDMIEYVLAQQTDVITLLEYHRGWDSILVSRLNPSYPYRILRPDLGYTGMAIYSRLPLTILDSARIENSRMLAGTVELDNNQGKIACYLMMMPLIPGPQSEVTRTALLDKVKLSLNTKQLPTLVLGEFSDPNWDNALRTFRADCNLYNSRVGMMVVSPCDQFPNFRVPSEHIFYSTMLECTEFQPIGNPFSDYIGLTGAYRFKDSKHAVQ
jgi:endonuclease/exonuclease/phosphatase (EEP) superfamily protein YafD